MWGSRRLGPARPPWLCSGPGTTRTGPLLGARSPYLNPSPDSVGYLRDLRGPLVWPLLSFPSIWDLAVLIQLDPRIDLFEGVATLLEWG